jgi:hypothetical protein
MAWTSMGWMRCGALVDELLSSALSRSDIPLGVDGAGWAHAGSGGSGCCGATGQESGQCSYQLVRSGSLGIRRVETSRDVGTSPPRDLRPTPK